MNRISENKIVLITRKTRLDELVIRFNTEAQARFYIEHLGADFTDYQREDARYKKAVASAQLCLSEIGRLQTVDRSFLPNFVFGEKDVIVAIGQDGLVANTLKYLDKQPVIGVNPDPERWEGVLLPFRVEQLKRITPAVFAGELPIRKVTMAKAELNTGQTLLAVNDLFIGPKTHTSARYQLQIGGTSERQSSSGIIVSTGLGSTGWLRSIVAGAAGIAYAISGVKTESSQVHAVPWDAPFLYFSVREPWPSTTTSANVTFGTVTPASPLQIVSEMPDSGVIFSDGIEKDFLDFQAGTLASIGVAERQGHIVVEK
ncbi:MAG: sugar kinase [Candidatus Hydrogenedentes bacterium]|nr:sugar kinase [Candidatus Hydrogenedentota bacterium]